MSYSNKTYSDKSHSNKSHSNKSYSRRDNSSINYYVSNSGSASNDGLSSVRPKLPTNITDFDFTRPCNILFNKGETFNVAITTGNNPNITFSSYGSGAKPILTGSTDISGLTWTNEGDGTWSTPMTEPNMIYIAGVKAKLSETAWITITSYPATNKFGFDAAAISGYASIVGARASYILRSWTTEYINTVTAYAAGVLTLNSSTVAQTSIVGKTFKLLGKKDFPMVTNGWAWEGNKLYIKTVASPATLDIRMSNYNIGITVSDYADDCTITGIKFKDYYYSGVKRYHAHRININNCDFHNTNSYPIVGLGVPKVASYTYNNISDCDGGIYDLATGVPTIQYNTFTDIGMGYNYGNSVDSDLGAAPNRTIYVRDNFTSSPTKLHTGGDISYNNILRCASTAIQLQSNMTCHHNTIHYFMQRFTDGGGIYAVANNNSLSTTNTEIYSNIISHSGATFSAGIYMDSGCISFNIHDNVIYSITDAGINVNMDTQFTTCANNLIVDCLYAIRYRQDNGTADHYAYNRGNVVTGNIMALRSTSQYCHQAEVFDTTVNYNPFGNGGSSNNNYYISPYMTRIGYHSSDTSMTFAELQTRYTSDANSVATVNYKTYVNQAQAELDVLLFINETNTAVVQSIGAGYVDVNGNTITSCTVPAYGGYLALKS